MTAPKRGISLAVIALLVGSSIVGLACSSSSSGDSTNPSTNGDGGTAASSDGSMTTSDGASAVDASGLPAGSCIVTLGGSLVATFPCTIAANELLADDGGLLVVNLVFTGSIHFDTDGGTIKLDAPIALEPPLGVGTYTSQALTGRVRVDANGADVFLVQSGGSMPLGNLALDLTNVGATPTVTSPINATINGMHGSLTGTVPAYQGLTTGSVDLRIDF